MIVVVALDVGYIVSSWTKFAGPIFLRQLEYEPHLTLVYQGKRDEANSSVQVSRISACSLLT